MLQGRDKVSIDPRLAQASTRPPPRSSGEASSSHHSKPSSRPSHSHVPSARGTMLQARDTASIDSRMAQGHSLRHLRPSVQPPQNSSPLSLAAPRSRLQGRDQQNSVDPRLNQASQKSISNAAALHSTRPPTLGPPPPVASIFISQKDITMAAKQSRFESLTGTELADQKKWADDQLKKNAGNCPMGYEWHRIEGGYQCARGLGIHRVTDELLQEGKGGYMMMQLELYPDDPLSEARSWEGPFYGTEGLERSVAICQMRDRVLYRLGYL